MNDDEMEVNKSSFLAAFDALCIYRDSIKVGLEYLHTECPGDDDIEDITEQLEVIEKIIELFDDSIDSFDSPNSHGTSSLMN